MKKKYLTKIQDYWINSIFSKSKNSKNTLKSLLFVAFTFLSFSDAFCQIIETYSSSTTWTAPPGITSVTVECWGGGGGGGNASHNGNQTSIAGGGAGGAYASRVVTVTPGITYTITVGNGGTGGNAGGDTWFSTNSTVIAKGGNPGANAIRNNSLGGIGSAIGSIGDVVRAGGNGATASATASGGGGGGAGSTDIGKNATNQNGGGTTSDFGGAGANGLIIVNNSGSNGFNGSNYGGGGSGAYKNINNNSLDYIGGSGAPGFIRLSFINPPSITSFTPTSACVGSTIIISGTDFTGTTNVKFNGINSNYTVNNNSQITATIPLGVTTGAITVTTPNGTATSSTSFFVEVATWNGTVWSNTPSANKELVFNGNFSSTANIEGCSCTVNSGNVIINSNHSVKLLNEITVNGGSMTFENNSSLIQINDATNIGNITYKRISPEPVTSTDYVYWSCPVSGETVPNGLNYFWSNAAGNSGNWVSASGQPLTAGKGVIMRGIANRNFTGVPFNGDINVNVQRRNTIGYDDNWNLIGNPYPSAISADEFLIENTIIEGSIAIWTHGTALSSGIISPFYGSFAYNYTPNDYIIYNLTGPQSGPDTYDGFVPAGQGFFVKKEDGPGVLNGNIKFKNSMRFDASGNAYNNTQFFRNTGNVSQNIEKSRIWIDIVNGNSASNRTVIGYIESATDGKDRLFDAVTSVTPSTTSIYSLIGNDKMCIQGKGLPFNNSDIIPLGFNAAQAGNYTIAIHALDGLFVNQDVYLLDTQSSATHGVIHNIKLTPYTFTATQGVNNTRFRLIFNNGTLSNPDFDAEKSVIIVNKDKLEVISNVEEMESIVVFDLLGRTIYMNNTINSREFVIPISQERAPLIVKIKLANGIYVERKTLY